MSSLADMDADKKVAVLKKAILALTRQKQDVEAAKAALEEKVASLMDELGKAEERNNVLIGKNRELTTEVERLSSGTNVGAAARTLLGTLGSLGSAGQQHGLDQQRLFEENEALHIQIFEQRSAYEKRIKQLEGDKMQQAMRIHSLEGLVASVQASDVATTQQAVEARRELAVERGYAGLCQYMLLRGLVPSVSSSGSSMRSEGSSQPPASLAVVASSATSSPASCARVEEEAYAVLGTVMKRCCEVIRHSMSGVSAVLPHTLSAMPSTAPSSTAPAHSSTATSQQLNQDTLRQRTVIAAHREARDRVGVLCKGLLADLLGGEEDALGGGGDEEVGGVGVGAAEGEVGEAGTNGEDNNANSTAVVAQDVTSSPPSLSREHKNSRIALTLVALLGEVSSWLHTLHSNASLLLGPLEPLHQSRCSALLGRTAATAAVMVEGNAVDGEGQVRTLEQQFQSVIASILGEMRVLKDCLEAVGAVGDRQTKDVSSSFFPFALRLLGAMLAYRNECAFAASSSTGGKLSLERLLYNVEAAANYTAAPTSSSSSSSGNASSLPTHYLLPLTHLIAVVKDAGRLWGSAFGGLASFDGTVAAAAGGEKKGPLALTVAGRPATHRRQKGALARAMAKYFAHADSASPNQGMPRLLEEAGDGVTLNSPNEPLSSSSPAASANGASIVRGGEIIPPASAFAKLEEEFISQLRAADANASHCYSISQRSMLELAHCHDRIEHLTSRNSVIESDNDRMRREYVSVVEVYESQIRLLSEHLAEMAQDGSVAANGKKR